MAKTNPNPPAKAGERESFETLYGWAAQGKEEEEGEGGLAKLFGSSKGPGIFNRDPLPAGFTSRTQWVRAVMDSDSEGNKAFFDALPQPYTNSLATIMAARGNPLYPPELVVEFTSRRPEEGGEDEYDDTASRVERLGLLAEIAALTRNPNGTSRVAAKLPFNGKLDFPDLSIGVFWALKKTEPNVFADLELDKVDPETGTMFCSFSADPNSAIEELTSRTLTPIQRFYLRVRQWDEQRKEAHAERERGRRRDMHGRAGDAAAALPQATPAPKPVPAPAGPAILDLSVLTLTGGGPSRPPTVSGAPPRGKKATSPAVVPPAAPPLVKEPKPTPAVDETETELVASFLSGQPNLIAKALAAKLRSGQMSLAQVSDIAKAKGLF